MKMLQRVLLTTSWIYSAILIGGCVPETLVVTPSQSNIARALRAHDHILCRTSEGATIVRPIEMVKQRHVNEVIHLELGNDELDVAVDQRFLIADEARFITADQLTTGHRLVNINGDPVAIDRIERRYGAYSLITLSVNEFHTFFVTNQQIVLHNNLVLVAAPVALGAAAKVALAGASITAIPISVPAAGFVIVGGCIYAARDKIAYVCNAIGRGFARLFGMSKSIGDEMRELLERRADAKPHIAREIDQMADPEPDDNGIYRVYEPSPKHYPTPHPGANLGPGWVEGQLALNASWFVSSVEGRETRISYWNGKMITFKFTQQLGKFRFFHGFYEYKVKDLHPPSFEVLKKNGVINHRGKFLK